MPRGSTNSDGDGVGSCCSCGVIALVIILSFALTRGEHDARHRKSITRLGYDWQLTSELPCLGMVPQTRSDAKATKQNNDDGDKAKKKRQYRKSVRRFEKCNPRNPESVKDSNSVLIRNRGYYNIDFKHCYNNFELHNESGKLTLETSCNWYWCAAHEGCVRRPKPFYGSKCTSEEEDMMISVFVICISIAFFGFYLVFVDSTINDNRQWFTENCFCFLPRGLHNALYNLASFIIIVAVVSSVPATVLFSIAMTECDQIYPFPVIFELVNQTNHSSVGLSQLNASYFPTGVPIIPPTPSPTSTPSPTTIPSANNSNKSSKSSDNSELVYWLSFVGGVVFAVVFCVWFRRMKMLSDSRPHAPPPHGWRADAAREEGQEGTREQGEDAIEMGYVEAIATVPATVPSDDDCPFAVSVVAVQDGINIDDMDGNGERGGGNNPMIYATEVLDNNGHDVVEASPVQAVFVTRT